tara:strand:- start:950 stop:1207 length:258 start_codon:yes stop_codon:yes gene_type:complete
MIDRNDPYYQIEEQERRCSFGWHNYHSYQNDEKEILICKICKHMQLPSDIKPETILDDHKSNNDSVNNKAGHQSRDGTINFDKTW